MSASLDPQALYFLPLGGTGEIGMNLNLYAYDGAWLMVDLGVTFADDRLPGIDLVMPDTAFIEAERERLVGLVLTHAHEDHVGAVPYLWPRLRCPIYATGFTASVVRRKLAEAGLEEEAEVIELPLGERFSIDPFELELITLTHSIPEPNAIAIRTPHGTVLHTGDWKFDPDPLLGDTYDQAALQSLADENVLALVGDSTNALVEGDSGSESEVRESLMKLVGQLRNRVAVACFASNVARLATIAEVAAAHGRRTALVGRSLWRICDAARQNGYIQDLEPFLTERDVGYLPREEVLMICTGSQGEPRSALARIANDQHPHVMMEEGDAVIFSSRVIPGNETAIYEMQNRLVRLGIEVLTDDDHFVHVSGHPCRDELTQMYQWVRPKLAVPVHGEARHLVAHAALAEECQVPQTIVGGNGSLIRLAPGPAEIVEEVEHGRLVLDGNRLLRRDSPALKSRQRIGYNGYLAVTLAIDSAGRLAAPPAVLAQGLVDGDEEDCLSMAAGAVGEAFDRLTAVQRKDDIKIMETARLAARRTIFAELGKKPVTEVQLLRLAP